MISRQVTATFPSGGTLIDLQLGSPTQALHAVSAVDEEL